jgi:hypothetical protein
MKISVVLFGYLLTIILILPSSAISSEKREFVIIDKAASAPVRSHPNGTNSLGRLPAGSKIEILAKKDIRSGKFVVTWYRIKFNGKDGWISQYVTMGDIITESTATKTKVSKRAHGSDKPREAKFDEEAKKNFKEWALNNTSVEWFEYQEDGLIWVKLYAWKYTTKENVQKIADNLARYYRLQTNYKKPIVVTVWDPYESKIWAKGRLP